MSNWKTLNACRENKGIYGTTPEDGFNGRFFININNLPLCIIASDGAGWKHVSVSIIDSHFTPSWDVMCKIKALFWEPEDVVVQFHPRESEYVNNHPGCLHLWQPIGKDIPTPDSILVGIK